MRKSTLLVLVISLSLTSLSIVNVVGHPPSDIKLTYSTETQVLSVNISHNVVDNTTHYIFKVEITKNSETPEVHTYTSQPSKSQFTYEYSLDATSGDNITVKTTCIISGSLTKSLSIPTGSTSATGTTSTQTSSTSSTSSQKIPGYLGWIIMISGGVSLLFLIRFYRSRNIKRD